MALTTPGFRAGFAANAAWEEAFAPLRAEIEETETAMRRLSRQMAQAQADLVPYAPPLPPPQ